MAYTSAPAMQAMAKRIDTTLTHKTMQTAEFGKLDVLMHEPLSDSARCLSFTLVDMMACNWSWGWCFWGNLMRPRSYVEVTENSVEFNYPVMPFCPMEMCVKDQVTKVYFDKLANAPYKADACTPYHTCCCLALCGEVLVVAPHPACANCLCLNCFPCLFKMYPGLQNGQALVDFIVVARDNFNRRKTMGSAGSGTGAVQNIIYAPATVPGP